MLNPETCQQARLTRDSYFDGTFFIGIKSTGIYCRNTCQMCPPTEKKIAYFSSNIDAAKAGYRPCSHCQPECAPATSEWKKLNTILDQALNLIDSNILHTGSLKDLASQLDINDQDLNQLFETHLGISIKDYVIFQQCLFAKQLITDKNPLQIMLQNYKFQLFHHS